MDSRESMIDIYKEIVCTNKNLLHFVKTNMRQHAKQNRAIKAMATVIGAGIVYIAFNETRYDSQNATIKKLSKEITELKKQKGE